METSFQLWDHFQSNCFHLWCTTVFGPIMPRELNYCQYRIVLNEILPYFPVDRCYVFHKPHYWKDIKWSKYWFCEKRLAPVLCLFLISSPSSSATRFTMHCDQFLKRPHSLKISENSINALVVSVKKNALIFDSSKTVAKNAYASVS